MEKTGLHPFSGDNFQNATTFIQENEKLMLNNLLQPLPWNQVSKQEGLEISVKPLVISDDYGPLTKNTSSFARFATIHQH